jgi:hypothetical protein
MRRINVVILLLLALIVVGLGATVVYRVRDASNRIKCQGNLMAMGIGLHGFSDATGHFPSATVPNASLPAEKRLSWLSEICPDYLVGGYASLLNKQKAWDDAENWPPRCRRRIDMQGNTQEEPFGYMGVLFCPAHPHMAASDSYCTTDYVGIAGVGEAAAELQLSDPHAGFFGYDRQITFKDIKDGTANTIAVVEVLDGGAWTAGGHATVRGVTADGRPYLGEGGQFAALHGQTVLSRSSGLNVLLADASVHYYAADLAPEVFEAMATIAGGEKVEGP